jgi:hypothetical protein
MPPRDGVEVHSGLQPTVVGNVSIVFISRNDLPHLHRTEDDVFRANDPKELIPGFPVFVPKWEDRLSAIGCVEKQIICTNDACSEDAGVLRREDGLIGIEDFLNGQSDVDKGIIDLMYPNFTVGQTIADAARGLGNTLVASQNLISFPIYSGRIVELQTALAEDQWKREIDRCENVLLLLSRTAYRSHLQLTAG